jgi:hypothetical protein
MGGRGGSVNCWRRGGRRRLHPARPAEAQAEVAQFGDQTQALVDLLTGGQGVLSFHRKCTGGTWKQN